MAAVAGHLLQARGAYAGVRGGWCAVVFGRRALLSGRLDGLDGIGERQEHLASTPGRSGRQLSFPTRLVKQKRVEKPE